MFNQPMLASPTKEADLANLRYPLLGSYKIDGIRAIHVNGTLMSRKMLPIPNLYTQRLFQSDYFNLLDGELVVGNPYDKNLMQQTMSGVMSRDGEPEVTWHIFDEYHDAFHYGIRGGRARIKVLEGRSPHIHWVSQIPIRTLTDLKEFEEKALNLGYEGIMLRDPLGPYKQGRSTLKQGILLKVKRFVDAEALVIGFKEQLHNDNAATTDARGYTKRSTHAEGKRAAGILGTLIVRDIESGVEFEVGGGFTNEQRINFWEGRQYLIGKVLTYKHFPIGVKDLPRFPVFKSWRDRRDM